MKVINPQFEAFAKLNKPQKPDGKTKYRRSDFCVSLPCEDGKLLYNTLTGALYLLDKNEGQDTLKDELIRKWCLVPENFDERKHSRQLLSLVNLLETQNHKKSFTIVTTTECNARCFYCFEHGCEKMRMTYENARDAAEYMIRVSGEEELELCWFGGEPLYNREAIEVISGILHSRCKPFRSLMVTNGYYLDRETSAIAFNDWAVRKIQITLDGTKQIYEKTKAYIDKDGSSYERVMDNIGFALDAGIDVLVRLNIDGNNANDLSNLADELGARFSGRKNMHAYIYPLREYHGHIPSFSSDDEAEKTCIALQEKLDSLFPGYKIQLPKGFKKNSCMADNDASELIMPDGGVERCEHIQHPDHIGSIYGDFRDENMLRLWKERVSFPECDSCALYPQCIILKRCDSARFGCSKADRALKMMRLEKQMIEAYRQYIQSGRKNDETEQ
ncbi:MAG: radical SAM protein [Clostridiales bacterium]|nr:radical SAM protein [Clostridiales bacterium]